MARIAILDDYQNLALTLADWSELRSAHMVTVFDRAITDRHQLIETLLPYDAVCLMRERTGFGADVIGSLPNLKLIVTAGMRNAAIDIAAATARGIVVSGTPQNSHATAELTLGLMLSLARHIAAEAASMRAGGWQSTLGSELAGKTLGIIGLGHLGSKVAAYGHALGMNVVAWSQNLTDARAEQVGARRLMKDQLFREADVITIHVKLSERSRGLVAEREFELMKPSAMIINTSRGPIIDEAALVMALSSGRIAGAGIDVFDEEPLPGDHPLRREPRALLTPHLGYWTRENLTVWYKGMEESVRAWAAGAPIRVLTA
ncbi:MAG: D-2-hydroxyacid dehydrogenase family protein [Hyphomicrobiaceae bacterium]